MANPTFYKSSEYEKLEKYGPTFEQVLRADPYEQTENLDSTLSEELFYEKFFFQDTNFEDMFLRMQNEVISSISQNELIVVHGYSGIGKTTFLKHFIRNNKHFEHYYINFNKGVVATSEDAPLTHLIQNETLKLQPGVLMKSFMTIRKNSHRLRDEFSHVFLNNTTRLQDNEIDGDKIREVISNLDFNDVFLFYMLCLFFTDCDKGKRIIYFDNLDAVEVEFISDDFLNHFAKAFIATSRLSQNQHIFPDQKIEFSKVFRFVFCLRNGNYSFLDSHIKDRLLQHVTLLPVEVYSTPYVLQSIIQKRLVIASDLFRSNLPILKLVEIIENRMLDDYFTQIFAHLFNCDYRKVTLALFDFAKDYSKEKLFIHSPEKEEEQIQNYAIRGSMMNDLAKFLHRLGYLHDYFDITGAMNPQNEGLCHPYRVVLNLILNTARRGTTDLVESSNKHSGHTDLSDLLQKLSPLYERHVIINTLERLFLYHSKNWVQLISITGLPIRKENDLLGYLQTIDEQTYQKTLSNIRISIAPAGLIYLKHVQAHFEFYSILANPQNPSLFAVAEAEVITLLSQKVDENVEFKFQKIMQDVIVWYTKHHKWMESFFKDKFVSRLGMSPWDFRRSVYSFRYVGKFPLTSGFFHSTRVATFHIDYLDRLRFHLISVSKGRGDAIQLINKVITDALEEYIKILSSSIDETAKESAQVFQTQIELIKSSSYSDTTTKVRI